MMHPMYCQMLDRGFSMEDLGKAGYFEDNFDGPKQFRDDKCIVLGLSGCFAPIHDGHIEALKLARQYFMEVHGYTQVKGILFPAHDSYVSTKLNGQFWSVHRRLAAISKKLREADLHWILQDTYPALSLPNEVNFPWLVDRLQNFASYNRYEDTAFVVGSDNASFAPAFHGSKTKFVVVHRKDGCTISPDLLTNVDYHEIVNNPHRELSSTKIRISGS